jgi:iron complex outermembrane receptor protein
VGTIPSAQGVEKVAFYGTPKFSGGVSTRYMLPLDSLLGELSLFMRYYHIDEVTYGSVEAPAGERLDLRFDWKSVLGSNFDVAAFATNVTDDVYPVASANSNEGVGINSAVFNEPRMYGVQLRYRIRAD